MSLFIQNPRRKSAKKSRKAAPKRKSASKRDPLAALRSKYRAKYGLKWFSKKSVHLAYLQEVASRKLMHPGTVKNIRAKVSRSR